MPTLSNESSIVITAIFKMSQSGLLATTLKICQRQRMQVVISMLSEIYCGSSQCFETNDTQVHFLTGSIRIFNTLYTHICQ